MVQYGMGGAWRDTDIFSCSALTKCMKGRLKMGYSDGEYDSKDWCALTHFKATWGNPPLEGEHKDTHTLNLTLLRSVSS